MRGRARANPDACAHGHTVANLHTCAHGYAHGYAVADASARGYTHADTHANFNSDSYTNSKARYSGLCSVGDWRQSIIRSSERSHARSSVGA